jgi:serine/threonine protein kinase
LKCKIGEAMSIDETWGEPGDEPAAVGSIIGGYRILSASATDERRTLYEAESVELGTRVTLGVVRGDGMPATERLRDGEKLRFLKQAGLTGVLEVGQLDNGDLFVATERAIGTPLRLMIKGGLLEQRHALAIVRQVLEALAAAHDVGAIHGDVRPENIFLARDGKVERVKLAELGVGTIAGAKPGDARYCAPGSANGAIDARADIYSVGAVLFELLTGYPPFVANDPITLRRLHTYAPLQTLKQRAPERTFNHALEELVAMALAREPEARFQSARDMIAVLDHALQSIEELGSPVAPRRRPANDSLLVLAKQLMPASAPEPSAAVVPVNVDRHVPELSLWTRLVLWLRRLFRRLRTKGR